VNLGSWKLYWHDGTPFGRTRMPDGSGAEEKAPGQMNGGHTPSGQTGRAFRSIPYKTPISTLSGTLTGEVKPWWNPQRKNRQRIRESETRIEASLQSSSPPGCPSCQRTSTASSQSWNHGRRGDCRRTAEERSERQARLRSLIPEERLDEETIILARIRRGESASTIIETRGAAIR